MNCSECYEISFQSCYGWLILDLGLTATTSYWIWIKDHHDNYYKIQITSDADGNLQIPTEDFPEGLFIDGSVFTMNVSTEKMTNTEEEFTIGYTTYTCIVFTMYKSTEI